MLDLLVSREGFHYQKQPRLGMNAASALHGSALHNVLFVQYVFLPTEQSETYFKIFILIFDSTYICPDLFDWKENTFFSFLCISNSKSAISLII